MQRAVVTRRLQSLRGGDHAGPALCPSPRAHEMGPPGQEGLGFCTSVPSFVHGFPSAQAVPVCQAVDTDVSRTQLPAPRTSGEAGGTVEKEHRPCVGQAALGLVFLSHMLVMADDDVISQTFIEVERMM